MAGEWQIMKNFKFSTKKETIEIPSVCSSKVLVRGDSGIGKTYMCELIETYASECSLRNNCSCSVDLDDIKVFLNEFTLEELKSLVNKIIFIDRADILLTQEMIQYIDTDENNQYIIFGNDIKNMHVLASDMRKLYVSKEKSITKMLIA